MQEREYETTFIYSKDGKEETFTLNNLPDSTWTFVDAKNVLVSGVEEDASVNFSFMDSEGNPVVNEIIKPDGPVFIVSIYNIRALRPEAVENIMALADTLYSNNLKLYIVSASPIEPTEELFAPYHMNHEGKYSILYSDYKAVITFNRSSGGLTYINSGIIIKKWARGNYPLQQIKRILREDPEIITATTRINEHLFAEISLFIILCLIIIIRFISKLLYKPHLKKLEKAEKAEKTDKEQTI